MKEFFKKFWVDILAFIFIIAGIIILAIEGYSKAEINPIIEQFWSIIELIGLAILAIKKLLQKKATRNK